MESTTSLDNLAIIGSSPSPGYNNWTAVESPDPGGTQGLSTQTIIQASILGVCTFLIVISNAFILLVLHQVVDCFEDMQQMLFKALAITDFLTGILCCALSMLAIIFGIGHQFSSSLCAMRGAACTGLTNLSALLITLACFDRFLAVIYPLHYPMLVTLRRAQIAVLSACCLAIFNAGLSTLRGTTVSKGNLCLSDFSSERLAFRPSLVTSLLILTITLTLTSIFNIKVMVVVHGHSRRLAAVAPVNDKPNAGSAGTGGQPTHQGNEEQGRNLKGLRVLMIATVSFFVAILPWNIVSASQFNPSNNIATPMARFVCSTLLLSNSWMNAVIFLVFNKRFRKAARRVLCRHQEEGNMLGDSTVYVID